eukprot:2369160-Amphidinium_carterae.1
MAQNRKRERGTVTNWVRSIADQIRGGLTFCLACNEVTQDYGFVKREGRHTDDIQLHISNAKGEKFKRYIR